MSQLPGIGKRTALRLVLHLLRQPETQTEQLTKALSKLRAEIKRCRNCYNISDTELCDICANPSRQEDLVCIVEDVRDVMAIENTGQYRGMYHVLGGKISPMDGIGPPGDIGPASVLSSTGAGFLESTKTLMASSSSSRSRRTSATSPSTGAAPRKTWPSAS